MLYARMLDNSFITLLYMAHNQKVVGSSPAESTVGLIEFVIRFRV